MTASLKCGWAREVHDYLRTSEAKWGKPFGMTFEELAAQVGAPPFEDRMGRDLLARMADRGWLRGVREPAHTGRKGGSQVRVRYFAAADMPSEGPAASKRQSYFDGLVRASSVFELGRIAGARAGEAP